MIIRFVIFLLFSLFFLPYSAYCNKTYVLNSSYSHPHSIENEQGYLDLILKEAFKRAGFTAEIRMLPAERCLQESNSGMSDGEIGRIRNISFFYPNLVLVDEPIIENRNFVAFSINHEFKTGSWSSLRPYNIAIMRGWKIFENNVTGTKSLIKMDSTLSMFQVLKNNRADVVVNAEIDGRYQAKKLGIKNLIVMHPPLASMELYLFLHKKNQAIVPKIEKALKSMKADKSFYQIKTSAINTLIY